MVMMEVCVGKTCLWTNMLGQKYRELRVVVDLGLQIEYEKSFGYVTWTLVHVLGVDMGKHTWLFGASKNKECYVLKTNKRTHELVGSV